MILLPVLSLLGLMLSSSTLGVVNGQTTVDDTSSNCTTITDIVCNNYDQDGENAADGAGVYQLAALCEAITIGELEDDLKEETWTLFAPNDDAFQALGRKNLDSFVFGNWNTTNNVADNTDNALTELLLFHLVGDNQALAASELPCVAGSNLITMANGENSRTQCEKKTIPVSQRGQYNDKTNPPKIIRSDIQACNGIVHIIDQVMLDHELPYPLPPTGNDGIDGNDDGDSDGDGDGDVVGDNDGDGDVDSEDFAAGLIDFVAGGGIDSSSSSSSSVDSVGSVDETSSSSSSISISITSSSSISVDFVDSSSSSSSSSANEGDDDDTTDDDEICQTIAQIACSNDYLSIMCAQLTENALLDDLTDGLWTVFVPTNEAFRTAPLNMMRSSSDMTDVLLGHTIMNELIPFDELVCTQRKEMTNGDYTRTVCVKEGPYKVPKTYQNGAGNDDTQRPEILDINIPACNGIIHIVSEVILPHVK